MLVIVMVFFIQDALITTILKSDITKAIDLKSYKNPSAINLDVTLDGTSTNNDLDVVLSGNSSSKQDGANKPQTQTDKKSDGVNSTKILLYGGAIILLSVLGFLAYKKFKK